MNRRETVKRATPKMWSLPLSTGRAELEVPGDMTHVDTEDVVGWLSLIVKQLERPRLAEPQSGPVPVTK